MKLSILLIVATLFLVSFFAYAESAQVPQEAINHFHEQALQLKNEGKYQEAEILLKQIINIQPENPNARFDLGNVYLFQKRYDEAIACYNEAIRLGLDKKFIADYHSNLSICNIALGNNKEAIYHLEEYLKINPDNPETETLLEMVKDAYKRGEKLKMKEQDE